MNNNGNNIYKTCRKSAGISLEDASRDLGICSRNLSYFEAYNIATGEGKQPPEDIVMRMAKLYGSDHLPLKHLTENTLIGREYLPKFQLQDLPVAFLKFQAEMAEVEDLAREMRKVVIDNMISDNEILFVQRYIKKISEGIISGWELFYSLLEKNKHCEIKNIKLERMNTNEDKIYARS